MRRILLPAIVVTSLLLFSGCENENVENEKKQDKESTIETLSAKMGDYRVVTLSGRISGLDNLASDFEYGIEYSTNESFLGETNRKKCSDAYSGSTFSIILNDIVPEKTYYYRTYYINERTLYKAEIKDFAFTWDYPVADVVDLGLSVKWATFNVGASNPEDNGFSYAFGEAKNKIISKWGDNWRIPTIAEWNELRDNCTWTRETKKGISGYHITSNIPGFTDRSVFLLISQYDENEIYTRSSVPTQCSYWSSSINEDNNKAYYIDFSYVENTQLANLSKVCYIRPVCPSETWMSNISMSLDRDSLFMVQGGNYHLAVRVDYNGAEYSYQNGFVWTSDNPSVATVDDKGIVHANSRGTAHVVVNTDTLSVKCAVTVFDESEIEHGFVDLGLSVKWATYNVGALNPEEYGGCYAWGETEQKDNYEWASYKWCNGSLSTLTKYCYKSGRGYEGYTDTLKVLDLEDDVAHVKWGGTWRMPRKQEQDELRTNCSWTLTTVNGVEGYMVTSKKTDYTDRSIFIPLVDYWSSSLNKDEILWTNTEQAYFLDLHSAKMVKQPSWSREDRCKGLSVRPVCP